MPAGLAMFLSMRDMVLQHLNEVRADLLAATMASHYLVVIKATHSDGAGQG